MQQQDARELLKKYLAGTCTPEEKGLLETWYLQHEMQDLPTISKFNRAKQLDEVWKNLPVHTTKIIRINYWPRVAAASLVFAFSFAIYFLLHKQSIQPIALNQAHDIAPASKQATLTLTNGKKIILTKGLSGKLAQQGNSIVQVNSGNEVAYTATNINSVDDKIEYNTLFTKKGEQSPYPLQLPDGSKIWLNAASSITFPTAFNGKDRTVTITGEAYLEVAHNPVHRFQVLANGQRIQDIGTHFNVNAYTDEPAMKTTLLEGSVKVLTGSKSIILQPGQQAVSKGYTKIQLVKSINVEETIAWKNGYFRFNDERIESVMRKLARWYNVDIRYQGAISREEYNGTIARNKNISQVLKMLEATKTVQFKVEGRRVTVEQK